MSESTKQQLRAIVTHGAEVAPGQYDAAKVFQNAQALAIAAGKQEPKLAFAPQHKSLAARKRVVTNAEFAAHDARFRAACSEEGLEPTARQASKYRAEKGRAYARRSYHITRLRSDLEATKAELIITGTEILRLDRLVTNEQDEQVIETLKLERGTAINRSNNLERAITSLHTRLAALRGGK